MVALALVISYLVGSIPFGWLMGWLIAGVDIRHVGSGNIGATNLARSIGWGWFPVVLLLDAAKGFGPAVLVAQSLGSPGMGWLTEPTTLVILAGVSAMIGHLWPIYLRFRGGKGIATGLGVIAALALWLSWWPVAASVGMFALTLAVSRYVSLASIVGALGYGGVQLALVGDVFQSQVLPITLFSVLGPLLVVFRHRQNIVRILQGTEPRVGRRAPKDHPEPS